LITRISVVGITVTTAALVILISAFNGIEMMIEKLYSEFDSDIVIRSAVGKTFKEKTIDFSELSKIEGVDLYSKVIEEITVLKHENKWVNARLIAVEPNFLKMTDMKNHVLDGEASLVINHEPMALIGGYSVG
jgi:lipoprotein-releasing system permease protein